jgi:hypothetical protein
VIGDSLANDEITEAVLEGNILIQVVSSRVNQKGLLGYALVRSKDIRCSKFREERMPESRRDPRTNQCVFSHSAPRRLMHYIIKFIDVQVRLLFSFFALFNVF